MRLLFWQLAATCVVVTWADLALAQRRPVADDTLGSERSIVTPEENLRGLSGDRIRGGARRGANLFHSFREFGIDPNRAVYFDDPGVQNIFSRVTGGNVSEIFGRLGVLGNANLFLLNPSGIVFGPNASLDVRGAFVASTANAIQFGEQGFFNASDSSAPPLLTVQPSAFLFNQLNQGAIENRSLAPAGNDGLGNEVRGLLVPNGQNLVLLGGNIINSGNLTAFGGRVELGSAAGTGIVGLNADGSLSFPDGLTRADVFITDGARIDVASNNGGNIAIHARNLDIQGGSVLQSGIFPGLGTVDSQAGNIVLNGTGEIKVGQSSLITNNVGADGIGKSGNIEVTAGSLFVTDRASLQTLIRGQGDAGNVIINATDRVVLDNSTVFSTIGAVNFDDMAVGEGGNVVIKTGSLDVINGAQIQASTFGQGNAGNVFITATDRMVVNNGNIFSSVGSIGFNGMAVGEGGNVQISTGSLDIINGAQIQASTFGQGNAGNVIINATDQVVFDGIGADELPSAAFSRVEEGAIGSGGSITIDTNSLIVRNGARLTASTRGQGNAGNVIIKADEQVVFNNSTIFSTVERGAVGDGRNIEISAGSLEVLNGAQLQASTAGRGNAGNVIINATDQVVFDGIGADELPSAAFSRVEEGAIGSGGSITIDTNSLIVRNGARLTASTRGQGNAGNVIIKADEQVVFDNSNIFSTVEDIELQTAPVREGGDIRITTGSLEVLNGTQLQASTAGRGNAGNVIIKADDRVVFNNSTVFSTVERGAVGDGRNIEISAGSLEVLNGAQLQASTAGRGNAGNVIINATDQVVFDGIGADELPSAAFSRVEEGAIGSGGSITIDTNSLIVRNGASLSTSTFGQGNAGNVIIKADEQVVFNNSAAFSRVEEGAIGSGGNIDIDTNSLVVRSGAQLTASTFGQGNAGRVTIDAETVSIEGVGNDGRSTALFTATYTRATERGGNIRINANSIRLANGAVVNAETANDFRGGDITINANTFDVTGGGQIITTTSGSGRAGNITLNVSDRITLSGFDPNYADRDIQASNEGAASGLFANTTDNSSGQGGTIRIRTGDLDVSDRARVVANSQGDGVAGNIRIRTNSLELTNDGRLLADTRGEGNAGNVIINADTFEATDGGRVITTTASGGQAGNITLNVSDRITLSDAGRRGTSGLFANTRPDSSGRGGRIRITTGELDVLDRARVVVNSQGDGVAGNMDITAQSVQLDRGRLTAETGRGRGGNITLQGLDQLQLRNDSLISATTQGSDLAGNIGISAQSVQLDQGSLTTRSVGGDGGNITLQDLDQLQLRNDSLISATAGTEQAGGGNGGNITIDADFIVAFPGEDSDIEANAFEGSGGNVEITTEGLLGIEARETATNFNDITASSEQGVQGTVTIDQPDADPSQGLTELPVSVVDASDQIAQTCPTDGDIAEEVGEFVVTGRGGLPANPAEMLGGETVLTELAEAGDKAGEAQGDREAREPNRVSAAINPEAEIMEAQGWVVGADGKVMLTAENPAVQPHSPATAPVLCPSS